MSDFDPNSLRCFNPLTGKRDGGYCVWEGAGRCLNCQAADRIDELESREVTDELRILRHLASTVINYVAHTIDKPEYANHRARYEAMESARKDYIVWQASQEGRRRETWPDQPC